MAAPEGGPHKLMTEDRFPVRLSTDLRQLPRVPRIVTIGAFDGVHRGHSCLLNKAVGRARLRNMPSLVVTFEPIPAMVLRPSVFPGRLCSANEKMTQLAHAGVNEIVTLLFSVAFSRQSPEAFMTGLQAATQLEELWVGEAFALGKDRAGDLPRLTEIGRKLGFEVHAVPRVRDGSTVISSSAIRSTILAGDIATGNRLLGRPFRVGGPVIHGAHFGRTIGYPTANVIPPPELISLPDGIYVSLATVPNASDPWPAMTYVGTRPTVNTGARIVETHLLDFTGDLYGIRLEVDVLDRLRGDAVFPTVDDLVAQLQRDEAASRTYFAERANRDTADPDRVR